jgi:hypothetical protein
MSPELRRPPQTGRPAQRGTRSDFMPQPQLLLPMPPLLQTLPHQQLPPAAGNKEQHDSEEQVRNMCTPNRLEPTCPSKGFLLSILAYMSAAGS